MPASVGSNWYRYYVHNEAFTLFLNGRIPFMPDKPNWLYPKDCMLALYGTGVSSGNDVWTWRKSPVVGEARTISSDSAVNDAERLNVL